MAWGSIIQVGGQVLGGWLGSQGAKSAANTQAGSTQAALDQEQGQYDQTRSDNMPLLTARNDALDRLEQLLGLKGGSGGIDASTVMSDPGYQFGLSQGQKQLTNSLNARGMRDSGSALKAATAYGNDYATTKYDAALNRQLNPLQSVAGLGQSGANTIAASGTNAANQSSGLITAQGNALAASQLARSNAYANSANQLAGWYQNYQQKQNQPPAGFNVDASGGYTYQQPWTVGP